MKACAGDDKPHNSPSGIRNLIKSSDSSANKTPRKLVKSESRKKNKRKNSEKAKKREKDDQKRDGKKKRKISPRLPFLSFDPEVDNAPRLHSSLSAENVFSTTALDAKHLLIEHDKLKKEKQKADKRIIQLELDKAKLIKEVAYLKAKLEITITTDKRWAVDARDHEMNVTDEIPNLGLNLEDCNLTDSTRSKRKGIGGTETTPRSKKRLPEIPISPRSRNTPESPEPSRVKRIPETPDSMRIKRIPDTPDSMRIKRTQETPDSAKVKRIQEIPFSHETKKLSQSENSITELKKKKTQGPHNCCTNSENGSKTPKKIFGGYFWNH